MIVGRLTSLAALLGLLSATSLAQDPLAQNPVALQREYQNAKRLFVLTAPARMSAAEVHARLVKFMNDTGSEVQQSSDTEIMARTTFATFSDSLLLALPVVVDVNFQNAAHDANGTPIYQTRRITLSQKNDEPVRVQFCSRESRYLPRTGGPPDVRVIMKCKLEFREWNALRVATLHLLD